MTKTGGTTGTGKTPYRPTGGTCDLGVLVGQARKDSVTSPCRLQPSVSRHKVEAAARNPPDAQEWEPGASHHPARARVLHLGRPASVARSTLPGEPPAWGGEGSLKPRTPYPQLSSGIAK